MRAARLAGALLVVCALVGLAAFYLQPAANQPTGRTAIRTVSPSALGAPSASMSSPETGVASENSPDNEPSEPQPAVLRQSPILELQVPQVRLRARVGEMAPTGGVVNPPTLHDAYRVTTSGVMPGSEAENTVYIAGHTCRQCDAVFNSLDQVGRVGDDVYLTTVASRAKRLRLHYVIEKTTLRPKGSLSDPANEEWAVVPGRLIIITCHLRDDGLHQTDNRVFFARYVGTVE